jgi:hypothetical protein
MNRFVRGAALGLAVVTLTVGASACDYVTRKQESKLLIDAAKLAERSPTASGALSVAIQGDKVSPEYTALGFSTRRIAYPPVGARFAFDRRAAHSDGLGQEGRGVPEAVFVGPTIYLKRPTTSADAESQFGVRAWSKLDFSEVGRKASNDLTQPNAINPINPTYLVRLLAGTLSGSVKRLGTDVIDGRATRHFRMNVDRTKAFSRVDDDDRQAVDKAFASNNISGEVFKKAEAWIDDKGLPRRIVLRFRQKLDQDNIFVLTYRIDLDKYGVRVSVPTPKADNLAEVSSLNALLSTSVGT